MTGVRTLTERLVPLLQCDWSEAEERDASMRVLDWAGCALGGRSTPVGAAFARAAPPSDHPEGKAFLFGSFGSLLEMDDVHKAALLHPGPVVIPAVLALADPGSGSRALPAVLAGYEAMIRLGRAVGPGHYARFHNTSTCGGLGAAVAVSVMMGLSDERMVWAMGHALSLSGGVWQCRNEPGVTKHLHVAEAARRGVMAARAAAAGIAAPRAILEGPQGFFAALAPDGTPEAVLADPDGSALLLETSYKPWPACRHVHPTIDALLSLRPEIEAHGRDRIEVVEIETFADALVFCDKPEPRSSADARFSLQHAAAVVLADGRPGFHAFDDAALNEPRYADLRRHVRVSASRPLSAAYPAHFGATVRVVFADGTRREATVRDALGDPENPVDGERVRDKYAAATSWGEVEGGLVRSLAGEIEMMIGDGGAAARVAGTMLALLAPRVGEI